MGTIAEVLSLSPLFNHLTTEQIQDLFSDQDCYIKCFSAGENIFELGSRYANCGIIVKGMVDVTHSNPNGSEIIVNRYNVGGLLGESFHITQEINNVALIRANNNCSVFFFDLRHMLEKHWSGKYDDYIHIISQNYMKILARTNTLLNQKIHVLTQKTLREKLMLYFSLLAAESGSNQIMLPFNRENLAQYVNGERSSVSRELSKMQAENLIIINGNNLQLLYL